MKHLTAFALAFVAFADARYMVKIGTLMDCGGISANVTGQFYTDPIPVPGEGFGAFDFVLSQDLPMDLVLEKMAWKIETGEVIPCLGLAGGFMGSCTVKLCESLDQIPDFFCPFFPENLPCNCPFLATSGTVKLNLTFSEEYIMYGPGDYEQKLRLISEANPEENLACVDIKYTLINA